MVGLAQGLWALAQERTGIFIITFPFPMSRTMPYHMAPHSEYYRMLDRIEFLTAQGRRTLSLKDITGDFS